MHDEYVHRRRVEPRAGLAAQLQAQPREQSANRSRPRIPSRTLSFLVLVFLGGTAFAFTRAIRGVPAQLVHLFHRDASPGTSTSRCRQPHSRRTRRFLAAPPRRPARPGPARGSTSCAGIRHHYCGIGSMRACPMGGRFTTGCSPRAAWWRTSNRRGGTAISYSSSSGRSAPAATAEFSTAALTSIPAFG